MNIDWIWCMFINFSSVNIHRIAEPNTYSSNSKYCNSVNNNSGLKQLKFQRNVSMTSETSNTAYCLYHPCQNFSCESFIILENILSTFSSKIIHTIDNSQFINTTDKFSYKCLEPRFHGKNIVPATGFEPTTFWLVSSCLGITFLTGTYLQLTTYWLEGWVIETK